MSECAPENRSAETETAEALPHDEYVKISIAKIAEINALIDELQMIKLHVADRLSQSKGLLQKVDGQVDLMRSQHVLDKQEKGLKASKSLLN